MWRGFSLSNKFEHRSPCAQSCIITGKLYLRPAHDLPDSSLATIFDHAAVQGGLYGTFPQGGFAFLWEVVIMNPVSSDSKKTNTVFPCEAERRFLFTAPQHWRRRV